MLSGSDDWQALGGFDPGVPCFRDGVELGWRATARGLRVVTTPQAEMVHRQVGRAGLRPRGAGGRHPDRVDQQLGHAAGRRTRADLAAAVHLAPAGARTACSGRSAICSARRLPRSRDELATLGWLFTHPATDPGYRRRGSNGGAGPDSGSAEPHSPACDPPGGPACARGRVAVRHRSDRYRELAGDSEAATLDELTGDEFATVGEVRAQRTRWLAPAVIIGVLLLLASLAAARGLFGLGHLDAPALLPAPDRLGELWKSAATPIPGAPDRFRHPGWR